MMGKLATANKLAIYWSDRLLGKRKRQVFRAALVSSSVSKKIPPKDKKAILWVNKIHDQLFQKYHRLQHKLALTYYWRFHQAISLDDLLSLAMEGTSRAIFNYTNSQKKIHKLIITIVVRLFIQRFKTVTKERSRFINYTDLDNQDIADLAEAKPTHCDLQISVEHVLSKMSRFHNELWLAYVNQQPLAPICRKNGKSRMTGTNVIKKIKKEIITEVKGK